MIVPRLRTPVAFDQLVDALDSGHHELRGWGLTPDSYAIAAAQLELEHGTFSISGALFLRGVFDDNLGNHDATRAERADPSIPVFDTVPEREVGAGGQEYHAQHVRRSYEDAVEGAKGYWQALLDGFEPAYDAICAGDPIKFVEALKQAKYFTGDEASYESFVASAFARWQARIAAAGAV